MRNQRLTIEKQTESVLDQAIRLTIFPDKYAATKKQLRTSLREFAERIPETVEASKGELPYVKLATFGDQPKPGKRCLRHDNNVRKIYGIEADYDGEEFSVAWAVAKLWDAGIAAFVCTTASHRPDAPRYRIFCPLSRPLAPSERERLLARLNGVLDGILAPESFTLSQSFYFGRVEGQPAPRVELVDGMAIDLADHLDANALDSHGERYGRSREPAANDDDDEYHGLEHEPDLERIRKALAAIPVKIWDKRDSWFKLGMAVHEECDGSEEGFEAWDEASQCSGKYDPDEQRRVWESFGSYRGRKVTIGTVYRLAKKYERKAKRDRGGLTFLTPAQCRDLPRPPYVVKGLIAEGDVGCIFGQPGAGKTIIAPHIGYQVALGESAFGMRTKQGTVFYVAAEAFRNLALRVEAIYERQGDAPGFRVVQVSDLYSDDSTDLEQLLAAVEAERPKLIAIDTLAAAFPGLEENDAASMGRVVAIGRQLAEHGAAVVFVHHGTKADGSTPRGHSVFNGALDFSMQVEKGTDGIVRGTLRKNRWDTSERDIAFHIGSEVLGEDEDGEPITAPVANELTGSAATRPPKLTAKQSFALEHLERLQAEGTVTLEQWAEATSEDHRVCSSPNPKSRQTASRRMREGLVEKGFVTINARGNVRTVDPWEDDTCDI